MAPFGLLHYFLFFSAIFLAKNVASFRPALVHSHRRSVQPVTRGLQAINGESQKGKASPASSNFIGFTTNAGKYVPSGLSPDEYEKIKAEEAEKIAKMDFAAWGPRFKRTGTPEGDWMVKPTLWIRGFQDGKQNGQAMTNEEWGRRQTRHRQWASIKSVGKSFLFAYILLDIFFLSSNALRSPSTTRKVMASILARNEVLLAIKQHVLASLALNKVHCLKLSLAAIATPILQKYQEIAQRRWLWSKRRLFGTPLLACVALVCAWSTISLRFLK